LIVSNTTTIATGAISMRSVQMSRAGVRCMSQTAGAIVEHAGTREGEPSLDAAMVLAARENLAAFEPLYRAYADRVYRYCLRRLDDPDRAADATSTIFIKAMQSISTCQPDSFRSWLFSIAHNVTIDAHRTRRTHTELDDALAIASHEVTPEDAALTAETRLEIVALLDHLTPDQRQVVELRLAGLDGYEIAAALGRSRAAVDTAQSRAVSRLRKLLGVTTVQKGKEQADVDVR
jgi:RNA polymerase sigma factor (sigma-70 family)